MILISFHQQEWKKAQKKNWEAKTRMAKK